jgi:hypothetical protein
LPIESTMQKNTRDKAKRIAKTFFLVACISVPLAAGAITPAGEWQLAVSSPDVKDYFLRIDVDPGETYAAAGYAPSSVYWAQYVTFNGAPGGYLGLQRSGGTKRAIVSIWDGTGAVGNKIPAVGCYEFGACTSIQGAYEWKVGHQYRFRVERSLRRETGWWQVTLADLTLGTEDILGEVKTPEWGGQAKTNQLFLEYFWGPNECQTLRHAKASFAPIRGNWGQSAALASYSGFSYGDADVCNAALRLPGMSASGLWLFGFGCPEWDRHHRGQQLPGCLQVGTIRAGGQGRHDVRKRQQHRLSECLSRAEGRYLWIVAHRRQAQCLLAADWKRLPHHQRSLFSKPALRQWAERSLPTTAIGDFFIYENPYNGDVEYYKLKLKTAGYFPIDKTSNNDWEYVGRHSRKNEPMPVLKIHQWGENNRFGRIGSVFQYGNMYFRLKIATQYWYFPTSPTDNDYWEFLGYHP